MRTRLATGFGTAAPRPYSRGRVVTASGCGPLTTMDRPPAGPQLPAASRPRTQSWCWPGEKLAVASAALTSTDMPPNEPDIGWPDPAGDGMSPNDHSACVTAEPPVPA